MTGGWYWIENRDGNERELVFFVEKANPYVFSFYDFKELSIIYRQREEIVKAPTCRELGEWLPESVLDKYSIYYTKVTIYSAEVKEGWLIEYLNPCDPIDDRLHFEVDHTEPNARAKMLIWLTENGYIKSREEEESGS